MKLQNEYLVIIDEETSPAIFQGIILRESQNTFGLMENYKYISGEKYDNC